MEKQVKELIRLAEERVFDLDDMKTQVLDKKKTQKSKLAVLKRAREELKERLATHGIQEAEICARISRLQASLNIILENKNAVADGLLANETGMAELRGDLKELDETETSILALLRMEEECLQTMRQTLKQHQSPHVVPQHKNSRSDERVRVEECIRSFKQTLKQQQSPYVVPQYDDSSDDEEANSSRYLQHDDEKDEGT